MRLVTSGWVLLGCLVLPIDDLVGQVHTATVTPSTRYETRMQWFMGSNWREVWATPIKVEVLNLATEAGGLKAYKAGGNQSKTLRFDGADGKTYVFRSSDKFINRNLPKDLKDTPAASLISDQSSALHPTAQVSAASLTDRLHLLQSPPRLVVLPDDPRLGEFRKEYAGLLGFFEGRPEGDDGEKTDFGAKKIIDSEKMLAELEQSLDHSIVVREYLAARLLDFIIGDADRGGDQWKWARYDEKGREIYRPIPRDHDYAFMLGQGVMGTIVRSNFPRLTLYDKNFASIKALTSMTREFDRSQLSSLPRATWDSVVTAVKAALTDQVIDEALAQMPPEHQALSRERMVAGLRGHRDSLAKIVAHYYEFVNRDVELFASNENDLAEVERFADGTVGVRLYSERVAKAGNRSEWAPAFDRRFVPSETHEIRIFMSGGNDRVVVRGTAEHSIKVRVIGGDGDDTLIDSSHVGHGSEVTAFYDGDGKNEFVKGNSTSVNTQDYVANIQPAPPKDSVKAAKEPPPGEERLGRFRDLMATGSSFKDQKLGGAKSRSWGTTAGVSPELDFGQGTGFIVGLKGYKQVYGFRHDPYQSSMALGVYYGTGSGGYGAETKVDLRKENSHLGFYLLAKADKKLESNRFYGFGNQTEDLGTLLTLVYRDEILVQPSLRYYAGKNWLSLGANYQLAKHRPVEGSPAEALPDVADAIGQVGVMAAGSLDLRDDGTNPHKGLMLTASAAFYPEALDITEPFTTTQAEAMGYLPLGPMTLALRAGGTKIFGDALIPLHNAAFVGGTHSLRGYPRDRFTGDAEAHGTAELRVPLFRVTLLTRGTLGVLGFYDVGRVWLDGASPGGWHNGYGGGLSFSSLGGAASVAYAVGEKGKFYFAYGLPF